MLTTTALLFAALLHATWNILLKRGQEPLLDAAIIGLCTITIVAIGLAFVPLPAPASWPYVGVGVGTRLSGSVLGYLFVLQLFMSSSLAVGVYAVKGASLNRAANAELYHVLSGRGDLYSSLRYCTVGHYQNSHGMASALRETSVMFANIMAVMF